MLDHGQMMKYIDERRKGIKPAEALVNAKAKPATAGWTKFYSPRSNVTRQSDRPQYAFIENTDSAGLRFVNFADKIRTSINHTGWYADSSEGDSGYNYRGAVWRLPHSRGFIAGYVDPYNDGAAFVELVICANENEAAYSADTIAENKAEKSRDYDEAWQAGREFNELGDEIASARRDCLELIAEAKSACERLSGLDHIKATIRGHIQEYRSEIRNARNRRAKLESDYGHCEAFRNA